MARQDSPIENSQFPKFAVREELGAAEWWEGRDARTSTPE